jgi:hypothetical protein
VWFSTTRPGYVWSYYTKRDDRCYLQIEGQAVRLALGDTRRVATGGDGRGGWHHAVAVWSAKGEAWLYVDGTLVGKGRFGNPGFAFQPGEAFRIGASTGVCANLPFGGKVDEFAVWGRALSAEEIKSLYAWSKEGRSYCDAIARGR